MRLHAGRAAAAIRALGARARRSPVQWVVTALLVGLVAADLVVVTDLVRDRGSASGAAAIGPVPRQRTKVTQPSTTTSTLPPTTTTAPPPPTTTTGPPAPVPPPRDLVAYTGLGTWVDVYDFAPEFQASGAPPPITPALVDAMAGQGIKTIFLQASKDDVRSPPGDIVHPELVGAFVTRAHAKGMRVVAWFLPKLADVSADARRLAALHDFRAEGRQFDGIGVDIEWRKDVPDPGERSARLVDLSRRIRAYAPEVALGAIVMPPVVTEVINPSFWPGFPWRELAPSYDVWLPMGYWTNRTVASGWRDAHRYTDENIRLLRERVGDPRVAVHAIGGIGDQSTPDDYGGFMRAAAGSGAVGASVYDYRTTTKESWAVLRGSG